MCCHRKRKTVNLKSAIHFSYHEFGIKLPVGCRVDVTKEESSKAKEEYAFLCKVPRDLDDQTLETVMKS